MCTITCEVGIIHINSLLAYLTYNEVSVKKNYNNNYYLKCFVTVTQCYNKAYLVGSIFATGRNYREQRKRGKGRASIC